jgi:hypothetical protein
LQPPSFILGVEGQSAHQRMCTTLIDRFESPRFACF